MNQTQSTPVSFQGGSSLPTPGTTAYAQAQQGIMPTGFTGAITPENLTPVNPVNVPPVTPTPTPTTPTVPAPVGTITDANGVATVPPPSTNTNSATPDTSSSSSISAWIKSQLGIDTAALGTKADVTKKLQDENQLADKTLQATTDYNTYVKAQKSYNDQIQAMRTEAGGTVAGGTAAITSFSQKANADLANLAINSQVSQGLLSAAEKTIKDKIDAQFQPITDQIDYLFKYADLNNNDPQVKALADQKKTELTTLTNTSDDLHKSILANAPSGERSAIYSSLDKISSDYASGKITAAQASSQMYQAAGKYGVSVQDQATKANTSKTYADIANNELNLNGSDTKASLDGDVQDVLTGRNTIGNIRLQMGRTKDAANYLTALRSNIRKVDPSFDFVASDAGSKFVSSTYYQKAVASINAVLPNIDKIVDLSNQVGRIGVKGVDSLLQKTQAQFGDKKVSNFHEAQKLIADEIGVALGAGTVSDMKLQLGFDVTDPSVTPEVFASNMGVVKDFLKNRVDGLNKQRYSSSTVNNNSQTVTSNGQSYTVGQVYNDGTANWTIDANGKWTKK